MNITFQVFLFLIIICDTRRRKNEKESVGCNYYNEAIDDIIPPDSDRPINIEKFDEDLSWWDLETNQISLLFYQESNNPRFGVRTPCIKRIYISEQSDQIILYLYYFR